MRLKGKIMERQFTVNDFVRAFEETCHGQHPQSVFRDWAEVTALSIANIMDPFQESEEWKNREDQYLAIAKKYRPETINLFSDLLGMLTMMFDDRIEDYLGKIYMDLGGNSKTGQFFTPWHLAKMTAAPVAGNGENVELIEEPSCGSGSMILGMAASLADKGINYQNVMKVTTHDLDSLCVHMCYIQLSLTGIRAKVIQGNTLANETIKVWYTPSYIWAGDRF